MLEDDLQPDMFIASIKKQNESVYENLFSKHGIFLFWLACGMSELI